MIIVKLKGGVGNQLFQYAMARSLALRKGVSMKMDIFSGFKNDGYGRVYALSSFNIVENIASFEEIAEFQKGGISGYLHKAVSKLKPYYKKLIITEPARCQFSYDANLSFLSHVYLDGYWQNERYFVDIADILRREFTLRFPLDYKNQVIADKIKNSNSVSVHLRRLHGVSVDNKRRFKQAVDLHGACSVDYYRSAIRELASQVKDLYFFVFSDDYDWAKKNLRIDYPAVFMTHNEMEQAYIDLHLMSLCKYHIIANSSLSWWGAWLSLNSKKMVFAPKYWDTRKIYIKDLTPASWRRIENY